MRFRHTNTYRGTLDEVHEMLVDSAFREEVCRTLRSVSHRVEVDRGESATTVLVDQTQVARKIPAMAQKLIGDHVEIRQSETWTDPDHATFEMTIPGKPGHLRGTITLADLGDRVEQTFSGDLEVKVPVIGGRLENLIADLLGKALAAEETVGVTWLDGQRS